MPQRAIVVGGGRVGSRVATLLDDYGHDPITVEQDSDRCERLAAEQHGPIIRGDATEPGILEQADPDTADSFAALTGDRETNEALCRRVKARPGTVRTVARSDSPRATASVGPAVDEVVSPAAIASKPIANAMLDGTSHLRLPATGVDLVELTVAPQAPAANEDVADLRLPSGSAVVADTDSMQVARTETTLEPGRQYLLAVEPDIAQTVRNLVRGVR
jgi:trk system potassium uptake protein TrkA